MVHKCFDKKSTSLVDKSAKGSGATLANKFAFKSAIKQNEQLAEELYKPISRIFHVCP